jgi:SAM-dependent methyltransferase
MKISNEIRNSLKISIGAIAEKITPYIAKDLDNGVTNGRNVFLKRMIFHARMQKAIKIKDPNYIDKVSRQWWTGDIAAYFYGKYTAHTNRFEDLFLRHFFWSVDGLAMLKERFGYKTIVEFGCGDGSVLRHLAHRLPDIDKLIGIDINGVIIEKNNLTADDRCSYVCSRIQDFFQIQSIGQFIAFTFGGVLEYLSPHDLRQFYANLHRRGCSITLVEPLSSDPKVSKKGGSTFIGSEVAYFDHDHAAYLSEAGFTVMQERIVNLMSYRWLFVVAAPKSSQQFDT